MTTIKYSICGLALASLSTTLLQANPNDLFSSAGSNTVNSASPVAPSRIVAQKVVDVTVDQALKKYRLTHKGAGSGFLNPNLFGSIDFTANNGYGGGNAGDIDSTILTTTVGTSFTTFYDISLGGLFSWSGSDGHSDFSTYSDSDTFTGSLFASKTITPWMLGGLSASYGSTNTRWSSFPLPPPTNQPDVDTDTWTFTPYLAFFTNVGNWSFSASPMYSASMQSSDYNTFGVADTNGSTGIFTLATTVNYAITPQWTWNVNLAPMWITNYEGQSVASDQPDRMNVNVGTGTSYNITDTIGLNLAFQYNAFNRDSESYTVTGGINVAF